MKALAIRQPYAWLIVNGHKKVEYRSWLTHYRGPFLVHAIKAIDKEDVGRERLLQAKDNIIVPDDLLRGGIVGVVNLVACERYDDPGFLDRLLGQQSPCGDQHEGNCYGFILEDPRPLPLVHYSGRQKFFNVPDDLYGSELQF